MALLASNPRKHVLAVIEINKIGKVMDLHPAYRPLLLDRFFEFFDLYRLLLHDAVAVHADACRRNARMAAGARRVMAIEARDLVVAGVDLVGKRDRLLGRISLLNADA